MIRRNCIVGVLLLILCLLVLPCCAEQYAFTTTTLKLRNAAKKDARGIDSIPTGTKILVTEYGDTWCQVVYGSKEGYVQTKYLQLEETDSTKESETEESVEESVLKDESTVSDQNAADSETADATLKSVLPQRPEGVTDISTDPSEIIIYDFDKGYWEYTSETKGLQIKIERHYDAEEQHRWYVAEIIMTGDTRWQFLPANEEKPGKGFSLAEEISRDAKVVFAINDDQCAHRSYNQMTVGVVIRNGEILYSKTYKNGKNSWPALDNAAFFADGTMKTYPCKEHTAEEFLEMGAENVLAFGPWLISDGQVNPDVQNLKKGKSKEARMGIGMIEPNHYVAIMVERTTKVYGVSLQWLANAFREAGCVEAFNLDGGNTASMVFMGKKLEYGNPNGIVRKDRAVSGMIGVGYSEQVPEYNGVEN